MTPCPPPSTPHLLSGGWVIQKSVTSTLLYARPLLEPNTGPHRTLWAHVYNSSAAPRPDVESLSGPTLESRTFLL